MTVDLRLGDCRDVLRSLPPDSVDACVTDPPYGMSADPDMAEVLRHWLAGDAYEHGGGGFMGKSWDSFVPGPDYWREVYRVLRPGAHLLAFAATRTMDLMSVAIRLAGFQCRDTISGEVPLRWVYGSGFPKSTSVSKEVDRRLGHCRPRDRKCSGKLGVVFSDDSYAGGDGMSTSVAPITPEAARWTGWGTALKPAWEPVLVFRKPLAGTVAANVLRYGTGGINVDGCRVSADDKTPAPVGKYGGSRIGTVGHTGERNGNADHLGRWPANLTLTHDEDCTPAKCADGCPVRVLDGQSGVLTSGQLLSHHRKSGGSPVGFEFRDRTGEPCSFGGDTGGASRFFYCAKPSRMERDLGCDELAVQSGASAVGRTEGSAGLECSARAGAGASSRVGIRNVHPTVKPVDLMRWLVRLVTPPGGTVLDPFLGSGTTGCAAAFEGFNFIGIEGGCDESPKYLEIARHRIEFWDKCGRNGVDPREAERGPEVLPGQVSLFGGGH